MDHFIIKDKIEVGLLMDLILGTGELLLKSGAETYRVEDTMERIANSRKNISSVSSFVTQTGVFLSLEFEDEVFSNFKRVRGSSTDLNKVHHLNEFSRKFVSENISLEDGLSEINEIKNIISYSSFLKALFGAIAAAFFSLMFGGTLKDFSSSFFLSIIVVSILIHMGKYKVTFFIENFVGALLITIFAILSVNLNLGDNIDKIIIGSIMYLVPGVPITNSIRDTMSGDSLSGISRGMEAVFCALAIALGVGVVLNIYAKGVF